VDTKESLRERLRGQRLLALVLGAAVVAELFVAIRLGVGLSQGKIPDFSKANAGGNVYALARVLFGPYFFPFEVTSVLLIIAAIGAMLHGRRRIEDEETIDVPGPDALADPAGYGPVGLQEQSPGSGNGEVARPHAEVEG